MEEEERETKWKRGRRKGVGILVKRKKLLCVLTENPQVAIKVPGDIF